RSGDGGAGRPGNRLKRTTRTNRQSGTVHARTATDRRRAILRVHLSIGFPLRQQKEIRFLGLAVSGERPDEPLLRIKIFRHLHSEHILVPSWTEEGWLLLIRTSGLNVVVRPDRNVEGLFHVAVQVTQDHVKGPVSIALPPLEDG